MSWLFLVLAIVAEVAGTTCMKLSLGFTQLLPSVGMVILYGISLSASTMALKKIDVSVAYAIWSGVGTALLAIIGIFWFKEPATALKILSILLIILGAVGLNFSGGTH